MDIWLDTTNKQTIQKAKRYGLLSGVTTNPTLLVQAKRGFEEVLEDLLHHQEGPVTAQVMSTETFEMVQQGQAFYSISNRLIVKVPITKNGLEAIHLLSRHGISTMATALFQPRQALMAALAGANYIAPYLGRMEKAGLDSWLILQNILHLFQNNRIKTKILGASLSSVEHVMKCAEIGIYGVTVKEDLFDQLIADDMLTSKVVEQFNQELKKTNHSCN